MHAAHLAAAVSGPVTDERMRLLGMVELEDLIFAEPDERIDRIMEDEPHRVHVEQDQEEVARLIQAADLLAVPVVDADERLVSLVTIDDAMDVLAAEEGEDLARTGASEPLGRPYLSVSILRLARSRVVWLMMLAVAATLTVNVLSAFEDMLEQIVSLSLFIPLLIGVGGNCGAQSATTVVRAMAVDDLRGRDFLLVLFARPVWDSCWELRSRQSASCLSGCCSDDLWPRSWASRSSLSAHWPLSSAP